MTYYTGSAQPMLNEISRTAAFFNMIRTKLHERRMYRETFDGLNALTDRELHDLGLHRGDLHRIAKGGAK